MKDSKKLCKIYLGDRQLEFILQKSGRKSIGISIDKVGHIKVTGPYGVSDAYINQVIKDKASWIINKLNQIETSQVSTVENKQYIEGEKFMYLGKDYKLRFNQDSALKRLSVRLDEDNLIVYSNGVAELDKLRDALKLWYIEKFKQVIDNEIRKYSTIIGVFPHRITIREQKTRWGSCSSKGNINLNWKLIMAPLEVLDYVIIHELCHMKEMNHSNKFWSQVENVCPQYKKYRDWLKENGKYLSIE